VYSPQLNNSRNIIVYTPPSYYENTLKVQNNVLVMHDGQNLFNASTSFGGTAWNCQNTIDQQVVQGNMDEVLIIGAYNTPDRLDEYTYSYDPCYQKVLGRCQGGGGKGDLYLDFLIENVVPYIAKQYRINTLRQNLGIMGSSLGGLISCYGGMC
jgi:predicted alpha/beta superfamily hydrolase